MTGEGNSWLLWYSGTLRDCRCYVAAGTRTSFEYTFELCWKSIRKALLFWGAQRLVAAQNRFFVMRSKSI
jgi:hypothetical protein